MFGWDLIEIYDDTASAVLNDNIEFALVSGWAPRIPARRKSKLGGRGPYEDAEETIQIHVLGSTIANALASLDKLNGLLDRATQWNAGESTTGIVKIRVRPDGSALSAPLEAALVTRADDGELVSLPPTYDTSRRRYVLQNVSVKFRRRGQWLGPGSAFVGASANSSTITNTTPSGPTSLPGPLKVQLGITVTTAADTVRQLIATSSEDTLAMLAATDLTGPTGYSVVPDTTYKARTGSVLRFSATGGTGYQSDPVAVPAALRDCREIAVYATVRNNAATSEWRINAAFHMSRALQATYLPARIIGKQLYGTPRPEIVELGTLANNAAIGQEFDEFLLYLEPLNTTGTHTIDIDTMFLIGSKLSTPSIVEIAEHNLAASDTHAVTIDPNVHRLPAPVAYIEGISSGIFAVPGWSGDAWLTQTGSVGRMLWVATKAEYWRLVDNGGNLLTATTNFVTYPAYLAPR